MYVMSARQPISPADTFWGRAPNGKMDPTAVHRQQMDPTAAIFTDSFTYRMNEFGGGSGGAPVAVAGNAARRCGDLYVGTSRRGRLAVRLLRRASSILVVHSMGMGKTFTQRTNPTNRSNRACHVMWSGPNLSGAGSAGTGAGPGSRSAAAVAVRDAVSARPAPAVASAREVGP